MGPVHWDDVEAHRIDVDVLRGSVQDLGEAAGSVEVGVTRRFVEVGCQTSPAHAEGGEEEIFFVLAGGGWSWQDGAVCEVRAGDVLVHRIEKEAHTLVAGDDGLDVLAFGERASVGATWLPRAGVVRLAGTSVQALDGPHPWEREAAAGRVDVSDVGPRPANVVAVADVEPVLRRRGTVDSVRRDVARAAGSVRTGMKHVTVAPGAGATLLHAHSAEEELFVVLAGAGTLVLGFGDDAAEHPLRAGSVVARPAGTGVAHQIRAADGDEELVLLAYGQRDKREILWYPRSRKVYVSGLGLIFRVDEPLDHWDGEE